MKLGAVSWHLVRRHGLVAMGACEERRHVHCECGVGVLIKMGLQRTIFSSP